MEYAAERDNFGVLHVADKVHTLFTTGCAFALVSQNADVAKAAAEAIEGILGANAVFKLDTPAVNAKGVDVTSVMKGPMVFIYSPENGDEIVASNNHSRGHCVEGLHVSHDRFKYCTVIL